MRKKRFFARLTRLQKALGLAVGLTGGALTLGQMVQALEWLSSLTVLLIVFSGSLLISILANRENGSLPSSKEEPAQSLSEADRVVPSKTAIRALRLLREQPSDATYAYLAKQLSLKDEDVDIACEELFRADFISEEPDTLDATAELRITVKGLQFLKDMRI